MNYSFIYYCYTAKKVQVVHLFVVHVTGKWHQGGQDWLHVEGDQWDNAMWSARETAMGCDFVSYKHGGMLT